MKALIQVAYGSSDALRSREVTTPTPADGEVLIRVYAVGLNAGDRLLLRGEPYAIRAMAGGFRHPRGDYVVGRSVAGRVEAVGAGVTEVRLGDEVYAECPASLAEFVTVPVRLVAPRPANVTFAEAAALPGAGTTALQALRRAAPRPGQRVLINGAAGGVGTYAVQIAVGLGARVTAVCAGRNGDLMTALGADEVIDYETASLSAAGPAADVILDLAGNYPLGALRRALAPGGVLMLSVGTGGRWLGPVRRIVAAAVTGPLTRRRLRMFAARPDRDDLVALGDLVRSGTVRPVVDRVYPFAEAVAAMAHLDRGGFAGKLVVTVAEPS
jgi:NADPH:quinone reductase-like Zn-dependent oxidoreductase